MADFVLQWQSCVVATESMQLIKIKIFTGLTLYRTDLPTLTLDYTLRHFCMLHLFYKKLSTSLVSQKTLDLTDKIAIFKKIKNSLETGIILT